jgi:hypothetical protein
LDDNFFLNDLRAKTEAAKKVFDAALAADGTTPDFGRNLESASDVSLFRYGKGMAV